MISRLVIIFLTLSQALAVAPDCDETKCKLPDCFCSGVKPPGGSPATNPQIVLLTLSGGSLTEIVYELVSELGTTFRNPNNCPFNVTIFTEGVYADFFRIEDLFYQQRYEIAQKTENSEPPTTFGDWMKQIQAERDILKLFANLPPQYVNSFQAPRLAINEVMYEALADVGIKYDHSRPTCKYAHAPNILFPYTYDYLSIQDCPFGECPVNSYPGLWEVPLIDFIYPDTGFCGCNFIEGCTRYVNSTADELFGFMQYNFNRNYNSNRAPFGLYLSSGWLLDKDYGAVRKEAVGKFLNYLVNFEEKDIWVVSISQLIDWMKNPVTSKQAVDFEPWTCPNRPSPRCTTPNKCHYTEAGTPSDIIMETCSTCPPCYPTAADPTGQKTPCPPFHN